jgi:hypothetical protein
LIAYAEFAIARFAVSNTSMNSPQNKLASVSPAPTKSIRWRFSLRSLLIAMLLFGVYLTPISRELIRAREVARQVQLIEQLGGWANCYKRNDMSATFASRYWLWRDDYIGNEIKEACFSRNGGDIAKLTELPELKQLTISGPVKWSNPSAIHLGIRKLEISGNWQNSTDWEYDIEINKQFPNVEEIDLQQVVATQTLIDDLGKCKELRSLRFSSRLGFNRGGLLNNDVQLVDFRPLTKLKQLRHLKMIQVSKATDWSFLADLKQVEDIEINPHSMHTEYIPRHVQVAINNWKRDFGPLLPSEQTPFHFLSKLSSLKKVTLYSTPAYATDIETLLANSAVEEIRFDLLPDGIKSFEPLRIQSSLKRLHVQIGFFETDQGSACTILEQLPGVTLSLGDGQPPRKNITPHVSGKRTK